MSILPHPYTSKNISAVLCGQALLRGLSHAETSAIKADLTFLNPQYTQGQQYPGNQSIPKEIQAFSETEEGLWIPRYFFKRHFGHVPVVTPPLSGGFYAHKPITTARAGQEHVVYALSTKVGDVGLQLPCGFGKSFLGLYYASKYIGRILVVVPTEVKEIEWRDEIQKHLGYKKIGTIRAARRDWEDYPASITVLKTLALQDFPMNMKTGFGTVIWDEAHLASAPIMSRALGKFGGVQIVLSATPGSGIRKKLIDLNLTERWIVENHPSNNTSVYFFRMQVPPHIDGKDWRIQKLVCSKLPSYHKNFANFIYRAVQDGRRVLALASHIQPLGQALFALRDRDLSPGLVVGAANLRLIEEDLRALWPDEKSWAAIARRGISDAKATANPILATGLTKTQPGGMGMDIPDLDGGVIYFPTASADMTRQLIGRWERPHPTKKSPVLYVLTPNTRLGVQMAHRMAENLIRLKAVVHFVKDPI